MGELHPSNKALAIAPSTLAERDDELRRLLLEIDQLDTKRAALQARIKLLLGLGAAKKTRSRLPANSLDLLARQK